MGGSEPTNGIGPHPGSPAQGLRGILGRKDSFTDLRRKKLTQVDVLSAAPAVRDLNPFHVCLAVLGAAAYAIWVLPKISTFGESRRTVPDLSARPGGPWAEVSLSFPTALSFVYISLSFLGINRMALRPLPVQTFIFECMAVHNLAQCLVNLYCLVLLICEGRKLGLNIWGNSYDATEKGYELGRLIWLQYHCRQLQLLETAFMVLRKKFQGVSFLHLYLRLLNLCGWHIACRCFGGGEAFVPAVICSACQGAVYGLYVSLSVVNPSGPIPSKSTASKNVSASRAARIFELQIAQYVLCAVHSVGAAIWGNFPLYLALLHLFVISNGLILYTDFHSRRPQLLTGADSKNLRDVAAPPRVTFSFDSCGWLFVYHFGVAAWISEHYKLTVGEDGDFLKNSAADGVAFSGSSGGSLISCVLGAGTKVEDVFEYILSQQPECRRNPLYMFPAVEKALRKFQYKGAHKRLTGRVRVLLTRVCCQPPFIMGEVADSYPDNETAVDILVASCHVPVVAGLLPRRVGDRFYYDGLIWPSRLLVPWRAAERDLVVRVSASGAPGADIGMRRVPYWWAVLPPSVDTLRGLFWIGYRDAARWFSTEPQAKSEAACRCRRLSENQIDAGKDPNTANGTCSARKSPADQDERRRLVDDEGELARWRAAQVLLRKPMGGPLLPEKDDSSGLNVADLVSKAEAMAEREFKLMNGVVLGFICAAAAVAVAAVPAFLF